MDNKQIDERISKLKSLSEEELVSELKNQYKFYCENTGNFNVQNAEIEQGIALYYYSKILEVTQGITASLEHNKLRAVIMPLLRCALEAFIELINIINIDGYRYYIAYKALDNKTRLSKNEFFRKNFSEHENKENFEEKKRIYDILEKEYSAIYFSNIKKLKLLLGKKFEFKLAKHQEMYDTVYWILCSNTHNDICSLSLEYQNNGNFYDIKSFNKMNIEDIRGIVATLLCILEESKENLYKKFNLI